MEWFSHLRIKAYECEFKEQDGRLKEQIVNNVNDNDMIAEIIRELTCIENIN